MGRAPTSTGGPVGESRITPVLEALRAHDADSTAVRLIDKDGRPVGEWTYGELCSRVDVHAEAVARASNPGDVVLLVERSAAEFVPWFLGALAAGCWVLPAPPGSTAREIERLITESGARCAVGGLAAAIAERHGLLTPGSCEGHARARSGSGGIILRTSGTTGVPKLVRRTSSSLDAVASNVLEAASLGPDDVVLSLIPVWHSYGIENAVLGPLGAGATAVYCESFEPGSCERLLREGGVTVFPGVPMMFEALSRGPPIGASPSLRLAYSAGSPLRAETAAAFFGRWELRLGQLYGATDVGSVTFNDPNSRDFGEGTVGVPMRGVSVRLVRQDGSIAGGCEEAQVAVRAPSMLAGYLGDHAMDLVDGHLLMGDLGRLDGAGRLTITGITKLLIDVGGVKVNPFEVEGVLREHPGVSGCAVVPIRVSPAVSRVRAIVTARAGRPAPDPAELRAWARERLAAYKVPRVIEVRDSLPYSPMGKLLRRSLEEL